MPIKFSNNASAVLAASINTTVTTVTVASGQGSSFPALGAGDYFYATLVNSSNVLEIVKVTARAGDVFTVVRGQDGTSGQSYLAGDRLELRPVAAAFNAIQDFTPSGSLSATTVQDAIIELDTEKAPINSPTFTGTPTAPTAAPGTNTTQLATTAFVVANIPTGVIVMWSGSVASIPSGWFLCNGSNGTPDLRNRFVVGAGSTYAVDATGGSADAIVVSHSHTASSTSVVTDPGHAHSLDNPVRNLGGSSGRMDVAQGTPLTSTGSNTTGITVATTTTVNSAGSSGTNANLPPYYALAYIMKG